MPVKNILQVPKIIDSKKKPTIDPTIADEIDENIFHYIDNLIEDNLNLQSQKEFHIEVIRALKAEIIFLSHKLGWSPIFTYGLQKRLPVTSLNPGLFIKKMIKYKKLTKKEKEETK